MSRWIRVAALVGIIASLYSIYIENEIATARAGGFEYKAACDFSWARCSTVLGSSYSHIFSHLGLVPKGHPLDVSNALMGLGFYLAALTHDSLPFAPSVQNQLMLAASLGSICFSAYLAYILRFVLHDVCIVCMSMYVANFIILLVVSKKVLRDMAAPKTKRS